MRLAYSFILILLLCKISSINAQNYAYDFSSIFPYGQVNPDAPDALSDFAYMIGECNCKSTSRNQDQTWQEPIDMIWRWKYIMNGLGVQDETLKSDGSHSGSIRQFHVDSSRWYVHYYNSARPATTLPVWEGVKKADGKIILYRDQKAPNGTEGWYRLTFSDMSVNGYNWIGEWVDKAETFAYPTWKIECIRTETPQKMLSWLAGTWQVEGKETYEQWILEDEVLTGSSYGMKNGEKDIKEYLRLYWKDGVIIFEARVLNQNDGKKIPFKLTHSENNQFIFTNDNHDFPNQISYTKQDEHRIFVEVSGADHQFSFHMNRQ